MYDTRKLQTRDSRTSASSAKAAGSLLAVEPLPPDDDAVIRHKQARARRDGRRSLLDLAPHGAPATSKGPAYETGAAFPPVDRSQAGKRPLRDLWSRLTGRKAEGSGPDPVEAAWRDGYATDRTTGPLPAMPAPAPPLPSEPQDAIHETLRRAKALHARPAPEPSADRPAPFHAAHITGDDQPGGASTVGGQPRPLRTVLALSVAGAAVGLALSWSMPGTYVASAELIADPREGSGAGRAELSASVTDALVESQLRVLRSGVVLGAVVDRLNLVSDPDFAAGGGRWPAWRATFGIGGGDVAATDERRRVVAIERLAERVSATRAGTSYGLVLSASTDSAEKSALLANAVAQAYVELQGGAVPGASAERLEAMRRSLEQAEHAVAGYRAEHDLVDAQGRLISDDEILRLADQLAAARARSVDLNARAASARDTTIDAIVTGTLPEQMASPVLRELRAQHAELRQQADRLAVRLGPRHPERQAVDAQLRGLRQQIEEELRRSASSIQVELRRAVEQEQELANRLAQLKSRQGEIDGDSVQLRQLEREAAARRSAYEEQLQRLHRTGSTEGEAAGGVRIISRAEPPSAASGASAPALTLGGGLAGLLAGLGLAGLRRRREPEAGDPFDLAETSGAEVPPADETEDRNDTETEEARPMFPYATTYPQHPEAAQPGQPAAAAPQQPYPQAPVHAAHPGASYQPHAHQAPVTSPMPQQAWAPQPVMTRPVAPQAYVAMPQPMPQAAHPFQPQAWAYAPPPHPAYGYPPAPQAPVWGYGAPAPMPPQGWQSPQHDPRHVAHDPRHHGQPEPRGYREPRYDDRVDPRTEAAIDEIRQSLREFREAIQDFAEDRERARRYGT